MNDEQRRMALFGAHHGHFLRSQPCGKRHFCTLLRYFSLMYMQYITLAMPCSAAKIAVPLRPELV